MVVLPFRWGWRLEHHWSVINAIIRISDNKTFSNQFHRNRNFCLSLKDTWCNRGRVSTLWFHKWFPPDWERRDWKRFPSDWETCQIFRFQSTTFCFSHKSDIHCYAHGPSFCFWDKYFVFSEKSFEFPEKSFRFSNKTVSDRLYL